jgi:Ser-tRNA(Ala) deacylase AlaX
MTELLYMRDSAQLQASAQVLDVVERDGKKAVILDQTIFYPQGGGQPADQGTITSPKGTFTVADVRNVEGTVHHFGNFTQGLFAPGDVVTMNVDSQRRLLLSCIHSAGHVIDEAVALFGYPLVPGKGYHFPEGPYVEYEGVIPEDGREQFVQNVQENVNRLIAENLPIKTWVTQETKQTTGGGSAAEKPLRFMQIGDFAANACGGTHIPTTQVLGSVTITKIKYKGGTTRISYTVSASAK